MIAALVVALIAPARVALAESTSSTSLEGVSCPGHAGEFSLTGGTTLTLAAGTRQLNCSYSGPGGSYLTLVAAWTVPGGSSADPSAPCRMPHASDDVVSATHLAIASYVTENMTGGHPPPPSGVTAVQRALLSQEEAVAAPCGVAAGAAPSSSTTTAPDNVHKALCSEATALLEGFGQARLQQSGLTHLTKTGLRVDGSDLSSDIHAGITRYDDSHADDRAYVSDGTPFAGEAGALNWLFSYGGAIKSLGRYYITGTENDLRARVIKAAKAKGSDGHAGRLTPGEVLELSLELNHGHLNQALLGAHNMLRTSARNDVESSPEGVLADSGALIDTYLVPLRDGENGGPWYHLFGTAYFEVVARGDWGPWLSTGAAAAAWGTGMIATGGGAALALGAVALAAVWSGTSSTSGTTGASRVANGLEQVVRETGFRDRAANRPDPEKFCFNVWGAQLGAKLYKQLPYRSTRRFRGLVSGLPEPELSPTIDPLSRIGSPRFVNALGSPYSVWWSEGTMRMLLDQGHSPADARLLGGVPGFVMPIFEGESWGVAWADPQNDAQLVVFEAARPGAVLHYVRTDTQTGKTAIYEATAARAGQQYSMDLDPVTLAPSLTRSDGMVVTPRIVQLDLAAVTTTTTTPAPQTTAADQGRAVHRAGSSGTSLYVWLAMAAALALVIAGTMLTRRRRVARRST